MSETQKDVVIIGGGLVGSVLAIALAQKGISITLIDKDAPLDQLDSCKDGRTTSVSYGAQQIFANLNIWQDMAEHAQPIWDIRVFEGGSPWTVDYDHAEIGPNPMGYIVENRFLRQALQKALRAANLEWIAPGSVKASRRLAHHVEIELADGQHITSSLLVGAEGRTSPSRTQSSICTKSWDYNQIALVTHITHEKPHNGTAWEIFLPEGPLAILPMLNCPETGKNRSGIVWVKSKKHDWSAWSDETLAKKIEENFPFYGKINIHTQRWIYPLSALKLDSIIDHRLALIGDAAHVVHPIAGQGVNLGWRDAIVLAEVISEAKSLGLDIGSATVLQNYEKKRKTDLRAVLLMTDGINRLFSNSSSILHFARNAGFAIVNHIPPLKRFFMRKAMGIK